MELPKSTLENPIYFFQQLFYNNEVIENIKVDFFDHWENAPAYVVDSLEINKVDEYVIHFEDTDEYSRTIPTKVTFAEMFNKLLRKELKISKDLLRQGVGIKISDHNPITPCLISNIRILNIISTKEVDIQAKYPFLRNIINSLKSYSFSLLEKYKDLDLPIDQTEISDEKSDNIEQTITNILGYLNGKNEKGEKIMSDSEHKDLIRLTNEMVRTNLVPGVKKVFMNLHITKGLLRFSFYVLYTELKRMYVEKLIGLYPDRKIFLEFIFEIFSQIRSESEKSLSTKFSIPYGKYSNLEWIPEIIREYKTKVKSYK